MRRRRAARQRRPRSRSSTPTRSSSALQAGRIRAALDVTEPEPLPEDHVLWTLDGVFITPHNAGDTAEAELAAQALARAQMLRYRAGLPLEHVVRPGAPGRSGLAVAPDAAGSRAAPRISRPANAIGRPGGPTGSGRSTTGVASLITTERNLRRRRADAVADRVGPLARPREDDRGLVAAGLLHRARRGRWW